ncbi:Protein BTN1 [Fusarium oxysporum f. sp. albedinis]|nr:Protein BTN1 [Fusarium oxysporum f. sp. albedinis]
MSFLNLRNWSLGRGAVGKGTVVEKWGRLVQYRLDREGTYGPAAGQFGFAKSSWPIFDISMSAWAGMAIIGGRLESPFEEDESASCHTLATEVAVGTLGSPLSSDW